MRTYCHIDDFLHREAVCIIGFCWLRNAVPDFYFYVWNVPKSLFPALLSSNLSFRVFFLSQLKNIYFHWQSQPFSLLLDHSVGNITLLFHYNLCQALCSTDLDAIKLIFFLIIALCIPTLYSRVKLIKRTLIFICSCFLLQRLKSFFQLH